MAKKSQKFLIGTAIYTLLFAATAETIKDEDSTVKCGGEERWKIKVLIDSNASQVKETPVETTIADLIQINTTKKESKYGENKPRMEIEKQVYKIKHCFITEIIKEDDNDWHLVIEDGQKHTMIAEIPDPNCEEADTSQWIDSYIQAKETVEKYSNNYRHYLFTVTGVLFVDRSHRQTGKAPNNVELHPVLEIKKEKKINPIKQ